MTQRYEKCIQQIFSLRRFSSELKLGRFERLRIALHNLGNPQSTLKAIHIAGTNGKGSTTTKLASILEASGHKVGLFTSPHICSFRERIRINGNLINHSDTVNYYQEVMSAFPEQPLFFEVCVVMALLYFFRNHVEYIVMETGMGGTMDATNVLMPLISVITSIGYDHMNILGDTLEKIAVEKAGVIKPYTPVVVGASAKEFPVFHATAERLSAPYYPVQLNPNAALSFTQENNLTVRQVVEILKETYNENIREDVMEKYLKVRPPMRMQIVTEREILSPIFDRCANIRSFVSNKKERPVSLIFDVGHNETAIKKVALDLLDVHQKSPSPIRVVFALSKERDFNIINPLLTTLNNKISGIYYMPLDHFKGKEKHEFDTFFAKERENEKFSSFFDKYMPVEKMENEFSEGENVVAQAVIDASKNREHLLFCGTFFAMPEVLHAIGLLPEWADGGKGFGEGLAGLKEGYCFPNPLFSDS